MYNTIKMNGGNIMKLNIKSNILKVINKKYNIYHNFHRIKLFGSNNSNNKVDNKLNQNKFNSDFENYINKLHKILENEINFEKENYQPINKLEKLKFCKDSGFTIQEEAVSPEIKMVKETDKFFISVYFMAREPINADNDEFPDKIDEASRLTNLINIEEIDQLKLKEKDSFKIQIKILKKIHSNNSNSVDTNDKNNVITEKNQVKDTKETNKNNFKYNSGFFFAGDYYNNILNIDHMYAGDEVNEMHDTYNNVKEDFSKYYYGPYWSEITVEVKNEIMSFLQELGITVELLEFIEVISQDKDQRLYMIWLEQVKKFFSN